MSYGINIANDSGEIFFSTDWTAFHFVGKYTASTAVSGTSGLLTFNVTCPTIPLVFIENTGNYSCVVNITFNGGTSWTIYVSSAPSTSLNCYVFSSPNSAPTSGYGMAIFDASGNTTFNSTQRVLKINGGLVTSSDVSNSTSTISNQSLSFGSIPTNYAVGSPILGEVILAGSPFSFGNAIGAKGSTTTVNFGPSYQINSFRLGAGVSGHNLVYGNYVLFIDTTIYQ